MALTEASKLAAAISPPIDSDFAQQLVAEFVSAERRYVLSDWEATELDGGQFAEILARIYYHLDSTNLNRTRDLMSVLVISRTIKTATRFCRDITRFTFAACFARFTNSEANGGQFIFRQPIQQTTWMRG
jgi:hypothetical protein